MSRAAALKLTLHDDDVPLEDGSVIDAGLGADNDAAAPLHEVRPLACFAHDERGAVAGGAVGRTWGACCELQQLWVHPAWRRQGLGARLVRAFEQRAQQRGCRTAYLETFSFQTPALYRALGYEARLTIDGYAPGICKHVMVRELLPAAPGGRA